MQSNLTKHSKAINAKRVPKNRLPHSGFGKRVSRLYEPVHISHAWPSRYLKMDKLLQQNKLIRDHTQNT